MACIRGEAAITRARNGPHFSRADDAYGQRASRCSVVVIQQAAQSRTPTDPTLASARRHVLDQRIVQPLADRVRRRVSPIVGHHATLSCTRFHSGEQSVNNSRPNTQYQQGPVRATSTRNPRVQSPVLAYEPGGRRFESCRAHHPSPVHSGLMGKLHGERHGDISRLKRRFEAAGDCRVCQNVKGIARRRRRRSRLDNCFAVTRRSF